MSIRIYSVEQVNAYIRSMFHEDFALRRLSVQGEVSNCKYHSSGHIYFTLKDENSQIACVMFSSKRRTGLSFSMKDGDRVVVTGPIEVFVRDGRYQLYADKIELAGAGVLYERYLALKNKLEKEGLFAPEHKKPIPKHVHVLGVVTAPTGAAVRDIIRNAQKRNPYVQLYLYPAQVQGRGAAESIVTGIRILDRIGCDCIIVGRGGGSIEDLWAFNEEAVAWAIYECDAPVISAVGHETDTTIADLVADLRVATPTEAAVRAVEDMDETFRMFSEYRRRLNQDMEKMLAFKRQHLDARAREVRHLNPESQIRERRQRASDLEDRFRNGMDQKLLMEKKRWNDASHRLPSDMDRILDGKEHRLELLARSLDGVSPVRKLAQGYSYAEDEKGRNVSSIADVRRGDLLRVHVRDGVITSEVRETAARAGAEVADKNGSVHD